MAIIVGVPIGLMVGMSKNIQYALNPFIQILKPVSPLAWLPLLLFAFKDINTTALATIFVTSIWPIIINTALGVKSVSEDYLNVAKVLRFNPLEKVFQIILPVAVPYIFTGMRLSLVINISLPSIKISIMCLLIRTRELSIQQYRLTSLPH